MYHVLAYDIYNNSGNYSKSGDDWEIKIDDITPPSLINLTGDFTTTTGESFVIYGNFTDNINISHADLYYKRKSSGGDSTVYSSIPMLEYGDIPGQFYITSENMGIDTFWDDRDILYFYKVHDKAGTFKDFRKISGLTSVDYKITVLDNDEPWLDEGDENITIGTGDHFEININFTDNINIDYIRFYYRNELWDYWLTQDFRVLDENSDWIWQYTIVSSELDVTIDTSKDDSDYQYYIRVFDGNKKKPNIFNYSYGSSGFRINVVDDDPPTSARPKGSGSMLSTTGETFTIYANFSDNIKVASAYINIEKQDLENPWSTELNMTESTTAPGRFYITNTDLGIDTTYDDSDFEYTVRCYDLTGNTYLYAKESDPFEITIIDNDKPSAKAGENHAVIEGTRVFFNANASSDNIGIISYTWIFDYNKLEQTLTGAENEFRFKKPGDYYIVLTVVDTSGNLAKDDLWVNVTEKDYPPRIVSIKPEDGEKIYVFEVKPSEIFVRFNESLKIEDINNIEFFTMKDSSDNIVTGSFSWNQNTFKLSFTPTDELKYLEEYEITVTTDVTDHTGQNLVEGKVWSFVTHPEDSENDGQGDNLPDSWEVRYFPEYWITQVGPSDDPDKDEFTNLEEFLEGTNPRDPNDHPTVEKTDQKETFNFILYAILTIIAIIIIIMVILSILILRKRKAEEKEEEEKSKISPIEHEILFESAVGDTADLEPETEAKTAEIPPSPGGVIDKPYGSEKVELESALQTGKGIGVEDKDVDGLEEDVEEEEPRDAIDAGELEFDESMSPDLAEKEPLDMDEGELDDTEVEIDHDEELDLYDNELDVQGDTDIGAFEDNIQKYIETGNAHYQDGNYSDAILEWQKALEENPDQPEIIELIKKAMEKMKAE
jgi:hypothetical protein